MIPANDADACHQWEWAPTDTVAGSPGDRADELLDALSGRFTQACHDPDDAITAVESILDELDLDDWTISDRTTNDLAGEFCVYPEVDGIAHTIRLLSVALPEPPTTER